MRRVLLSLLLIPAAWGAEISLGLPESELLRVMGEPTARVASSGGTVYQWASHEVGVKAGKVTLVRRKAAATAAGTAAVPAVAAEIGGFREVHWGDDLGAMAGFVRVRGDDRRATYVRADEDRRLGDVVVDGIVYETVGRKLAGVHITAKAPGAQAALRKTFVALCGNFVGDQHSQLWGFDDTCVGQVFLGGSEGLNETWVMIRSKALHAERADLGVDRSAIVATNG